MTAKTKKILTILLTILGLAAFVITPLAWFANYWDGPSAGVKPGSNYSMPNVTMWMFYAKNDATTNTDTVDYWKEYTIGSGLTISDPDIFVPSVKPEWDIVTSEKDDGTTVTQYKYKYNYESLQFGKVDNLIELREDNKIYMRFEFNVEEHGDRFVQLNLSYVTSGYNYDSSKESVLDSIHLYDMSKLLETQDALLAKFNLKEDMADNNKPGRYTIEHRADEPEAMQFMEFRYVISTDGTLNPTADDFNALFANADVVPINCGQHNGTCPCACACVNCKNGVHNKCTATTPCHSGECGTVKIELDSLVTTGDTPVRVIPKKNGENEEADKFYIYVELAPRLDTFGMQENILDYFVPSYMLFDVKFDIEIG